MTDRMAADLDAHRGRRELGEHCPGDARAWRQEPNLFIVDVAARQDSYYDKALEGCTMFALNQGEVCTCPSRALIRSDIYADFLADATTRTELIKQGNPLDSETMMGAQASNDQLEKILSYIDLGKQEGAKLRTGGERADLGGELSGGYYVQPTKIANDTPCG